MENRKTWQDFDRVCLQLADHILAQGRKFKVIAGPQRGGLIMAARLSYLTGIRYKYGSMRLTDDQVIVDDYTRTGKTLATWIRNAEAKPYIVTWLHSAESAVTPAFWLEELHGTVIMPWQTE